LTNFLCKHLNSIRALNANYWRDWLRLVERHYQRWDGPRDEAVIRRFPIKKQRRMDHLAERYNEGELSADEETEYLQLVDEVRRLTTENVNALAHRRHPEMFKETHERKLKPSRHRVTLTKTSRKRLDDSRAS
jgi:broad specificity phosphatase PhoE